MLTASPSVFYRCLLFLLIFSLPATILKGQTAVSISTKYTKLERMIMMRDGAQLYTAIYLPNDSSANYPFLISRTPYSCSPYGENNYPSFLSPNPALQDQGYIFVFQDVRGRYMSEGKFREMTPFIPNKQSTSQVDESSDAYDTIDWLLKNIAGHNGKVGLYGVSYPGFYALAALPEGHPAIAAVSPQAPIADEFEGDDVYHRGAFFLMDNVSFLNGFGEQHQKPVSTYPPLHSSLYSMSDYEFYKQLGPIRNINEQYFKNRSFIWNEYLQHDTKDDYWKARNIRPWLKNVKAAVFTVGGWFDAEDMFGPLRTYEAIEKQNTVRKNYLMMGPWTHGGWRLPDGSRYATYSFGRNPNEVFRATEAAFFRYYLKDKGAFGVQKAAIYFTGSNEWKTFGQWPPANTRNFDLYLVAGNKLSTLPQASRVGFEMYDSDPANPVPYSPKASPGRDMDYLGADQRFSAGRPDVLVFTSDTLKESITLAGPVVARLFASLSSTDADFVIKLIDLLPDGTQTQQLVRAEVLRGKFRNSFSKPEPFVPGKITPVTLTLNDVAHTFKEGHQIMIHIQSSWFPLVDMNPQQFMRIPDAGPGDFQKATISIQRNARYQSVIQCKILKE
jgi:putative CocE/NonD family hydrolase